MPSAFARHKRIPRRPLKRRFTTTSPACSAAPLPTCSPTGLLGLGVDHRRPLSLDGRDGRGRRLWRRCPVAGQAVRRCQPTQHRQHLVGLAATKQSAALGPLSGQLLVVLDDRLEPATHLALQVPEVKDPLRPRGVLVSDRVDPRGPIPQEAKPAAPLHSQLAGPPEAGWPGRTPACPGVPTR